jgi:hypothetical protein
MFHIHRSTDKQFVEPEMNLAKLVYDYYPITCGYIQAGIDISGLSFVSANYVGKINQPTMIYIDSNGTSTNYQSRSIYAYGKLHTIGDIDYDGEIVIEHESTVSSNTKLYVCFLVKCDKLAYPTNRNSVAEFAGATGVFSPHMQDDNPEVLVSMNEYLSFSEYGDGAMYYEAQDNTGKLCRVVIFTTVITTSVDLSKFSIHVENLFSVVPMTTPIAIMARNADSIRLQGFGSSRTVLSKQYMNTTNNDVMYEGFEVDSANNLTLEGEGNDIFSCEYLPISTDTAKVYQIPINTDIVTKSGDQQFTSMTTYIILSVLFTVFVFIVGPIIYNSAFLTSLRVPIKNTILSNIYNTILFTNNVSPLDAGVATVTAIISFTMIGVGVQNSNSIVTLVGVFFLLIFGLGAGSIHITTKLNNLEKSNSTV